MPGNQGHWAWVFFNVQHLLWHGASDYNGHLRGYVKQWGCHYYFDDLGLSTGFEHPTSRMRGERCNWPRHRRGLIFVLILFLCTILASCFPSKFNRIHISFFYMESICTCIFMHFKNQVFMIPLYLLPFFRRCRVQLDGAFFMFWGCW